MNRKIITYTGNVSQETLNFLRTGFPDHEIRPATFREKYFPKPFIYGLGAGVALIILWCSLVVLLFRPS